MRIYGYIGLAIILIAEALLFSGNLVVGRWFTPIVWTGYILLADALVYKFRRRSLISTDRTELLIIAIISIACWWLFEFYNEPRFWASDLELWWHYHNLEPNPFLRRVGYDWAFATIFPAMFITAQLLAATVIKNLSASRKLRFSKLALNSMVLFGAVAAVVPLVSFSTWLAPVIWLSFIFLLDPINYARGWPSIIGDLERGIYRRLFSLLASGAICGFLWEFWNFWALSKWTYTVPYLGNVRIFEMPVLGYLGFPFFAVECWVMYIFLRSLLSQKSAQTNDIWFESIGERAGEIYFGAEHRKTD
jgi:hypothetical protein